MRHVLTFAALTLPSLAAAQGVGLTTTGTCPGTVDIEASGLTPGGKAFVVAADALGNFAVPAGSCSGTDIGLDAPTFYRSVNADGNGEFSISPSIPANFCDSSVVVLDTATCEVSPPATLLGATRNVTFRVDMGCAGIPPFGTVHVTGPWANWDVDYPMSDSDGDGVWELTVPFAVGADVEYKYMVDAWADQEDLIDDMVDGYACAPVTDYYSYANRLEVADNDLVLNDTYGQCLACGAPALATVSFEVDMNCSGESPYVVGLPGPDVGWDFWARTLTDGDGDGFWTGQFDLPNGKLFEYTIAVDNWAGQEDLVDDMIAGGECAPITDFYSYANRLVEAVEGLQVQDTYGSCDACP